MTQENSEGTLEYFKMKFKDIIISDNGINFKYLREHQEELKIADLKKFNEEYKKIINKS